MCEHFLKIFYHTVSRRCFDPKYLFGSTFTFLAFSYSFFFLFFSRVFCFLRQLLLFTHCSWDPQSLYSEKNNKNGSHGTIHTFKNYFATVFSVFSFSNNKFNPNGLLVRDLYFLTPTMSLFPLHFAFFQWRILIF